MANDATRSLRRFLCRLAASAGAGESDRVLLARFAALRDEDAFTLLFHRHGPMVLGVCRRVLQNQQDAEDALQATFLVLAQKAGSVGNPERLANWLYGVAYRSSLQAKRRREQSRDSTRRGLAGSKDDPAQAAMQSELRAILDDEISRLPTRYRLPFILCHLEGRTNEQAAETIGCPKGTILSRLSRARDKLRVRLRRRGIELSAATLTALLVEQTGQSALPPLLASSTIKAALTAGTVTATAGVISLEVSTLAQGVMKAMWLTKVKIVASVVLAISIATAGTGVVVFSHAGAEPQEGKQEGKGKTQIPKEQNAEVPAQAKKALPTEFEGTWRMLAAVTKGVITDYQTARQTRIVVVKDKLQMFSRGQIVIEGTYQMDPTATPMRIDIRYKDESNTDRHLSGIYRRDYKNLQFLLDDKADERPSDFNYSTDFTLWVFEQERLPEGDFTAGSLEKLKYLAFAMHNYHDVNKSFPPSGSTDAQGKPLLSWRVHVLPFIGQTNLYEKFHLDEPWDSKNNKPLIQEMPALYRSPLMQNVEAGKTTYLVPVGPQMIFEGAQKRSFQSIRDGTSNTIMIVDAADAKAVYWTQPEDMAVDENDPRAGLRRDGVDGFPAVFADGSLHRIQDSATANTLWALFTRSGGENVLLPRDRALDP